MAPRVGRPPNLSAVVVGERVSAVLAVRSRRRYMRNLSKWPDINAQAKETLRGPGFFDMPFEFSGPGYDLAYSTLLGGCSLCLSLSIGVGNARRRLPNTFSNIYRP